MNSKCVDRWLKLQRTVTRQTVLMPEQEHKRPVKFPLKVLKLAGNKLAYKVYKLQLTAIARPAFLQSK